MWTFFLLFLQRFFLNVKFMSDHFLKLKLNACNFIHTWLVFLTCWWAWPSSCSPHFSARTRGHLAVGSQEGPCQPPEAACLSKWLSRASRSLNFPGTKSDSQDSHSFFFFFFGCSIACGGAHAAPTRD